MRITPAPQNNGFRSLYIKWAYGDAKYTDTQMNESDYMQTEVWKKIRRYILQRDGYRCKICGSAHPLHVHHIRYPDVWGTEDPEDLVTVCDRCHNDIHQKGEIK